MTLNFIYMKYFCDAVKLGGVTAAAKANFVTQSAVSQGIKKLEGSLECTLLSGHPNQFRLTPEGYQAFQQMSDILKRTMDFKENFSNSAKQMLGDLEFVTTFSVAHSVIPDYLKRFCKAYPHSKVNLQCSGNSEEIKKRLRIGELDFAILMDMGGGELNGFEQRLILEGHFGMYVSRNISISDEKKLGFILTESNDTVAFRQAYVKKYRREPIVNIESKSWMTGAYLVDRELGIGYFPDYVAENAQFDLRLCDWGLNLPKFKLYAIHLKEMRLRKSSEIFLSYFTP